MADGSRTWTKSYRGETYTYDVTENHVWVEVIELRRQVAELTGQVKVLVSLLAAERE